MSKNKYQSNQQKTSQLNPKPNHPTSTGNNSTPPQNSQKNTKATVTTSQPIQAEATSLEAYQHIQTLLTQENKELLSQEDLNAVLRLSQHLRIFGLLSAVGYINQSNDQEGKVRERTVPIWKSLIASLLQEPENTSKKELMSKVAETCRQNSSLYLQWWRQSLIMSNHWNFWARAYSKTEPKES